MSNLTEHFSLEEMMRSDTATRKHIDNTPSDSVVTNLRVLCSDLLEPLREHIGMPIHINSGYRCETLNKAVGGAKYSYHLWGMAADLRITGPAMAKAMADYLLTLPKCDEVIYETKGAAKWLHVQWSYSPRHKFLNILK